VFFVASALTLLMSHESRAKRDQNPTAAFFVRRFMRIAPPFWLAAFGYLAYQGMGPRAGVPEGVLPGYILSTLAFVHGWHPHTINLVVPGGWSIAVEMNFYLLLPLLAPRIHNLKRSLMALVIALVVSVALSRGVESLLLGTRFAEKAGEFTYYWLPRQGPVFLLGFVLYYLMRELRERPANDRLRVLFEKHAHTIEFVALGVLLVMSCFNDRIRLAYLVFSVVFVVLALCLAQAPSTLLVNRFSRYLGKVSFSAYLTHFVVLDFLANPVNAWVDALHGAPESPLRFGLLLCCTVLATTLLSTIAYHAVELPGQRLGERVIAHYGWGPKPKGEPAAVPALKQAS
jgi:peptidoglycan/LPS O-acetylase OafA/YrhL